MDKRSLSPIFGKELYAYLAEAILERNEVKFFDAYLRGGCAVKLYGPTFPDQPRNFWNNCGLYAENSPDQSASRN